MVHAHGALAAAMFGIMLAAQYHCGATSSPGGYCREQIFNGGKDAGKQMHLVEGQELEMLLPSQEGSALVSSR